MNEERTEERREMTLSVQDINDSSCASEPLKVWSAWVIAKRGLDILASAIALILVFPLCVLIAALVKMSSPGPAFFRWSVIGQGGKPFVGYKFRSMIEGADQKRDGLNDKNEMTGIFFKMQNDPRVTPLGRILRRFSIDELPQLWSVLRGDMSLVGPRPTQIFEYEQLEDWQKRRASVKPGAVSLWLVSGKTNDFGQMVSLDLKYIDNWSLWLDLKILFRAIPYVLLGKNS